MDPHALIGPVSPMGFPAPYWFLVLFKVLGFALHVVPMNLLFAGLILSIVMRISGNENARRLAARFARHMPIIVACAVNLGIVPLLFTQVAYYQLFYPATILMAWPWFAIIPILTVAYYGIYFYASGFRESAKGLTRFKKAAGWVSAILFILIGFLFANGFSLMTNLEHWPDLLRKTSVAGAPLGLGLNLYDPTLWPRWLLMFSLAITTTATYWVIDAGWFARNETSNFRSWSIRFAFKLYSLGIVCFAVVGSWYVFGAWTPEPRQKMLMTPWLILTVLTALSPGLPWLLIALQTRLGQTSGALILLTGIAQFTVIALNAISRQVVQNIELQKYTDVSSHMVQIQLSPLIVFLVIFVAGALLLSWMIGKAFAAFSRPASRGSQ